MIPNRRDEVVMADFSCREFTLEVEQTASCNVTLAKLAERCGQLVMHWSRSDVETFVILDEGTTYRYRTTSAGTPADDPGAQEFTEADRVEDLELGQM